jgi:16S rRNA (guanine966-N2)-methyltransferase
VRIVGGTFRGRRLKAPTGLETRPTSEKVREALFDILGPRVNGSAFMDVYAGTGAVGIEALSRGASEVVFVESGPKVVGVLRSNIEGLGREAGDRCRVLPSSVDRAFKAMAESDFRPGIVFCDPPYADKSWPAALGAMRYSLAWRPGGLLVVEHAAKNPPKCPEGFEAGKSYRYGDSALSFFWFGGAACPGRRGDSAVGEAGGNGAS